MFRRKSARDARRGVSNDAARRVRVRQLPIRSSIRQADDAAEFLKKDVEALKKLVGKFAD